MEIKEFQQLIREIYGNRDNERGLEKTFLWFIEEVGELSERIRQSLSKNQNIDKNKYHQLIAEELADVFAWGISLANLTDIDLEKAILEKYPGKCLRCGKKPCVCKTI
ncbi:MAG: MazG nucleotide pyrophosphohydrolase domain-containing protein [Promethearchaeota archaeon]